MASKITTSFLWDFLGKIGSQLISLVIGIVLARLLSPTEYGLIGMAMVFIAFSGIFTNLGLSSALIQRKDPNEEHFSSSFYFNIGVALLFFILFIILAPFIADFFNEPKITNLIRVLSLNILINSLIIVQSAIMYREMLFKAFSKIRIISTLISGIIGIAMALIGFGVWSLVIQTLISSLVQTIYIWLLNTWRPKIIFKINALKELWTFGFHLFLNGIMNVAYNNLSTIIIAKIFSAIDLGLFTRAESLNRFVIKYSSESIGSVIYPAMTKLQEKKKELIDLGAKSQKLISFTAFGLLGLLYLTAEPFILFLLGEKWKGAIEIYKILCLSGFALPISAAATSIFKAHGNSKEFLWEDVIKKIVGFAGMAIGFFFGLEGFLYSLVLTGLFNVLLDMYYVEKIMGYPLMLQLRSITIYPIITITIVLALSYIPMSTNSNFFNLIIYGALYCSGYILINSILKTMGFEIFKSQLYGVMLQMRHRNSKAN